MKNDHLLTAITVRDDLREATREASAVLQELHGVFKDIVAERKRIDAAVASIPRHVGDAVGELARKELVVLGEMTKAATDEACERVTSVFDRFTSVLLGEDAASKRKGSPSLKELMAIRDVVMRMDAAPPTAPPAPPWFVSGVAPKPSRRKS